MESRMSRTEKYSATYEDESSTVNSRVNRNQDLYKEVSYAELDNFDLNSNVSILGQHTTNIDISKIKDILDERYNEEPRKNVLGDTFEVELPKINLDETREYDINSILAKVKEEKEIDYEEDRLKKVNQDASSILQEIDNDDEDIEENEEDIESNRDEEKLQDLINTIVVKEMIKDEENMKTLVGEMDPLDLLTELRGDDDSTRVMGIVSAEEEVRLIHESALKKDIEDNITLEEAEANEEAREKTESIEELIKDVMEAEASYETEFDEEDTIEVPEVEEQENYDKLDNSFIGDTNKFSVQDFEDFEDLKDNKFTSVLVKILIALIIIMIILGGVVIANKVFGLGLF